jgi:hypothetical protein
MNFTSRLAVKSRLRCPANAALLQHVGFIPPILAW